jgi:hypothetical protein
MAGRAGLAAPAGNGAATKSPENRDSCDPRWEMAQGGADSVPTSEKARNRKGLRGKRPPANCGKVGTGKGPFTGVERRGFSARR